jgi:hypothetical protein
MDKTEVLKIPFQKVVLEGTAYEVEKIQVQSIRKDTNAVTGGKRYPAPGRRIVDR